MPYFMSVNCKEHRNPNFSPHYNKTQSLFCTACNYALRYCHNIILLKVFASVSRVRDFPEPNDENQHSRHMRQRMYEHVPTRMSIPNVLWLKTFCYECKSLISHYFDLIFYIHAAKINYFVLTISWHC